MRIIIIRHLHPLKYTSLFRLYSIIGRVSWGVPLFIQQKTTIYKKSEAWNGYTIFNAPDKGAVLIDMNGNEVHVWKDIAGFPNKMLPGGYLLGNANYSSDYYKNNKYREYSDVIQVDWEGNVVWSFNRLEQIKDPTGACTWSARQHHDFQREGNPVGYYAPNLIPKIDSGNTLLLCHRHTKNPNISDKLLLDDIFIEVDWQGNIVWEWVASDHFAELGLGDAARNVFYRNPNLIHIDRDIGDYLHINSVSRLGPNKHYDNGNEIFHPENIIWSSRETNIFAIISRKTGQIVWRIGPDYTEDRLKHLGIIIGQHHVHLIPQGLPGAGNILLFDNGGHAGYGLPTPTSSYGLKNASRDYSRVLEFDPINLQIVWQHSAVELGYRTPQNGYRFYSPYVSSVQRLPNGNTLITEGADGRIIEVTQDHKIVWEYISPYQFTGYTWENMVYRAYRVPYDWVPQLDKPDEIELPDIDNRQFHIKA